MGDDVRYLTLVFLLVSACSQLPVATLSTPEVARKPLAWANTHFEWDKALYAALDAAVIKDSVTIPCKNLSAKNCLAQTISVMAKYESSFNPAAKYIESFADVHGVKVVSRGLLQISQESANQKVYGCNIKDAKELYDPAINLTCAVKIAVYQINKSGKFYGDNKEGMSAYWSVMRPTSKSQAKIISYLNEM